MDLRVIKHQQTRKRFIGSIILLVFVACLLPIALPTSSPFTPAGTQEEEVPYPCQGGHCGCDSAKKCWTSCCCTTPAEREIWARKRGITPPSYAVRPTDTPPQNTTPQNRWLLATSQAHQSCVAHSKNQSETRNPSKKSCCKPTVNSNSCATTNSITVTQNSSSDRDISTTTAKNATKPIRYWLGISAAKCNGTNWDFLQLSWIPNDFPKIEIPLFSCIHIASNAMPLGASDLPPEPPPPKA